MPSAVKEKRVTTTLIAKRAGCSQSAVFQILSGSSKFNFSEETRQKVQQIADEMGYYRYSVRRAIKKPLKHIGLMVTVPEGFEQPFMTDIFDGVCSEVEHQGYLVMIKHLHFQLGNQCSGLELEKQADNATEKMIELVTSRVLDGVIVDKSRFGLHQMQMLEKASVPFVCINASLSYNGNDIRTDSTMPRPLWVAINHIAGSRTAVEHLIKKGHRRIAILMQSLSAFPSSYAPSWVGYPLDGYKDAMATIAPGFDYSYIREVSLNRDDIVRHIDGLLALKERPTAIFAADRTIAVAAASYLQSKGVRIPDDISIVGYGSSRTSELISPLLTYVDVPWREMGVAGANKLISFLEGRKVKNVDILENVFVEGNSVKNLL